MEGEVQSVGPAFSASRVITFSDLPSDEKEQMMKFLVENNVACFKDADGSYAANVRLYDPRVIDLGVKAPAPRSRSGGRSAGGNTTTASASAAASSSNGDAGPPGGLALAYRSFARFTSLIGGAESVKPKVRPIAWVMRHVEEIFDSRYSKDTAELRGEAEPDGAATPFPTFVVEFFSKRYGLRSLIDQTCWDLIASVDVLRRQHLEVETFARFLEEAFDPDDLLFFLYVRSVVQKELGVSFRSRWTELGRAGTASADASPSGKAAGGGPAPLFLTFREVQLVSRVVFGSEADPLYKSFVALVERHLSAPAHSAGSSRGRSNRPGDDRRVEVTALLFLALEEYHETRPDSAAAESSSATSAAESLLAAAAATESPTQSEGSAAAGGASAGLLEDLGAATHAANVAYVDRLLADAYSVDPAAASRVPPHVASRLRSELISALESTVDTLLAEVISSAQAGGAPTGKPSVDALAARFSRLISASGPVDYAAIGGFCEAVLDTDDIREGIEPLVSMLINYAVKEAAK